MAGLMHSVLLVVFDGLRPDMIHPEITPNLVRFQALGTRLPRARSVFPSETRVCTASVATGCHPRGHGVVANRMFHPADPTRFIDTGDAADLRAMQNETGKPVVLRPGLSDILAKAGRDYAVFSSGSTGQTFILAPNADALGQIVVSAHGTAHSSAAGQAILARLPSPPAAPADRAVWIADAWRTTMLPNPPAASVLWLCEPDTSAHYMGLDSDAQRNVLHAADAAFGRLLDDWQAGPQKAHLQIIAASDHGHITVDGLFETRATLAAAPELAGCSFSGGGTTGVIVPGADRERIAAVAEYLMRQDWVAHVIVADIADPPAGTLPRSAVMIDHPRTGHVLFTLRNSAAPGPTGLPGSTLVGAGAKLAIGAGMHGELNRGELSTVLMLAGSAVRPGVVSNWPAGLVDIAPTILALLDIPGGVLMDGRVLGEALEGHSAPVESHGPETWEAAGADYAQRVARMRVGRHVWLEHGARLS